MASGLTTTAVLTPAMTWRRYFGDVLLLGRFVVAFAILFGTRHGTQYIHHVAFIAALAIVTSPVRGIGWGTIYDFFVAGLLGAYVIVAVQWVIEVAILHRSMAAFRSAIIAPVTEEPLKIAPLVLLMIVFAWRARWWSGACDMAACGVALGSGFAFVEDSMRRSTYPTAQGPHLFRIALTPDAYQGFIGHGGSTGLIALAFGWWLWARRWKKWRTLGLIPVMIAAYWMLMDHGLANYNGHSMDRFSQFIWRLDGNGMRAPYAFVVAIGMTFAAEWIAINFFTPKVGAVRVSRCLEYIVRPIRSAFGYRELRRVVTRTRGVLLYRRSRRQLRYVMLHARGDASLNRKNYAKAATEVASRVMAGQTAISQP
jgi:RsiW-degrading membrane proteinase PrsW (M82 family)